MPRIWQVLPVATLLAVSGCVGMVVVHEPVDTQSYYDGAVEYAASKGELRVEVVGNPYGTDKKQFDEQVVTQMRGANYGPPVTFTTRASEKTRQAFKVVAVFNAPKGLTAEALCACGATDVDPRNSPFSNCQPDSSKSTQVSAPPASKFTACPHAATGAPSTHRITANL